MREVVCWMDTTTNKTNKQLSSQHWPIYLYSFPFFVLEGCFLFDSLCRICILWFIYFITSTFTYRVHYFHYIDKCMERTLYDKVLCTLGKFRRIERWMTIESVSVCVRIKIKVEATTKKETNKIITIIFFTPWDFLRRKLI